MRMVMLVFNETLESEVSDLARASGLDSWTRLDGRLAGPQRPAAGGGPGGRGRAPARGRAAPA